MSGLLLNRLGTGFLENGMGELKAGTAITAIGAVILGLIWLQYRIIHDCGWFGLLEGSEWLWLFGACH